MFLVSRNKNCQILVLSNRYNSFMEESKEMPYLEYFSKTISRNKNACISGTCYTFCPNEEISLREREKLVHILEVIGDEHVLVKSYSRSAADANIAIPKLLRPYNVLKDTVHYLLYEVSQRSDVPLTVVYDFLTDRLRAVRQDMTIQRLPPEQCMEILEPIIRFHVYYGYRLCEKGINEYDPVLNNKYLLECVKWFLSCADELDKQNRIFSMEDVVLHLENMKFGDSFDRILVESLYILSNLDDTQPLVRYLGLPQYLKRDPKLKLAYKIAVSNLKGNFIKMCRLAQNLCPLTTCAFLLYLPSLQRKALQIMSSAYNSKQLVVPTTALQHWLLFNDVDHVKECCEYYGLTVDSGVHFNKSAFKKEVNVLNPRISNHFLQNIGFKDVLK